MPVYSPIYLKDQDGDPNNSGNPGGGAGGGGGGGVGVGGPGTVNAMTKRWIDVNWSYTEPQPAGACTGFEVAVFANTAGGTNIDAVDAILAAPIEYIPDPTERRYIMLFELRTEIQLRAAVRACYGDFRSAWANATATATFTPNPELRQTDNGTLKMPDGTIMQWFRSNQLTGQQDHTIAWPTPFPNELYCMALTTEEVSGNAGNDSWLVLRAKSRTQITVYKQSVRNESNNMPLRAYIVGWGR